MPKKDEEIEQIIPTEWRPVIIAIVDDIRRRTLRSKDVLGHRVIVDIGIGHSIYDSIDQYGGTLSAPSPQSWEGSVCRWMGSYWQALIDLNTEEEGLSDLVLFLNVYEDDNFLLFKVTSLHVP